MKNLVSARREIIGIPNARAWLPTSHEYVNVSSRVERYSATRIWFTSVELRYAMDCFWNRDFYWCKCLTNRIILLENVYDMNGKRFVCKHYKNGFMPLVNQAIQLLDWIELNWVTIGKSQWEIGSNNSTLRDRWKFVNYSVSLLTYCYYSKIVLKTSHFIVTTKSRRRADNININR